MSTITSEQVMSLRSQTGAGVMDCKNALKESAGDLPKAIELLRKKGLAGLAKRAGRAMKEGLVLVKGSPERGTLAMIELNCETDFVAKNPGVRALAGELADAMLADPSMGNPAENEKAREKMQALAIKTGENMQIRRGTTYRREGGTISNYYVHSDNRKGAVVELSFDGDMASAKEELLALAKELAMQCVAMNPRCLRREDVSRETIENEREIYKAKMEKDEADAKALAAEQGKPFKAKTPEAVAKMLDGRVNKFFQEHCLLEQVSIRETKLSVTQFIKTCADRLKGNIQVRKFDCYLVGLE